MPDGTFTFGFLLKKWLGAALMPVPLILFLLVLALWWSSSATWRVRATIASAMVILALSCFPPIAAHLLAPHQGHFPAFDTQQPVSAVVVLGSGSQDAPEGSPAHWYLNGQALHNLLEGLRILQANPQASLLVSGYGGLTGLTPHALSLQQLAIDLGVDPARIRAFPEAVDTEAEARLMAPWLEGRSFALITSETHMRRAVTFFRQAGLEPLPAPSGMAGETVADWRLGSAGLYDTERAIYEWLGLTWQSIKGVF